MRFAILILIAGAQAIAAAPPPPVAATPVEFELANPTLESAAAELSRQTGIPFAVPAALKAAKVATSHKGSFWSVVDHLATEAKCRVRVIQGKVQFLPIVPGSVPTPMVIDGAFLAVVRHVNAKRDVESAGGVTEIHFDVCWEPRFPVYLIDAEPTLAKAAGEKGTYTGDPPSGRVFATGYVHPMTVRLKGVPREEKSMSLSGSFNVIAANKLLAVEFKDLTSDKPIEQVVDTVKVTLKPVKSSNGQLEIGFDLEYPESHPMFESFQEWAGTNKLRVFDPQGKIVKEADYNTSENGRKIAATYFLPAHKGPLNLKDWRLVYETPSPMVEQKVRFELKDVVLP